MEFVLLEPVTNEDYDCYLDLRWTYLRKPWGQAREKAEDSLDSTSHHVLAKTTTLVPAGIGRVHRVCHEQWQIRYMVVATPYRRMGLGKQILCKLECIARENGANELILQARENALPFYYACGYLLRHKSHMLYGSVQHFEMVKVFS